MRALSIAFLGSLNTLMCVKRDQACTFYITIYPTVKRSAIHVGSFNFPYFASSSAILGLEKGVVHGMMQNPKLSEPKSGVESAVILRHSFLVDPHWGDKAASAPSYKVVAPDPNYIFHHPHFLTCSSGSWSFSVCPKIALRQTALMPRRAIHLCRNPFDTYP